MVQINTIVRQFANYSLRAKLIIIFLLISLLSVGTIAFFANRTITQTITEQAGENLQKLAASQALVVGDLIGLQVEILRSLSLSRNIKTRLLLANAQYGNSQAEIISKLEGLDKAWRAADDESNFVQTSLNNVVSIELNDFQNIFPNHIEIFVTDKKGALIAATNRTPDYYHADKDWWQAAYNEGQGGIYISPPVLAESSGIRGLEMAVPFYDDKGTVVGILRSTYSVEALTTMLTEAATGQENLHLDLLLPDARLFIVDESLDSEIKTRLEASIGKAYDEFVFNNVLSFVSQTPIAGVTDDPIVANLGWTIIARQDKQVILGPVQTQTRAIIVVGLFIAVAAVIVAFVVAQRLANPITRLTAVARQVTTGDLTARAGIESGDEVGVLAETFNSMTDQLRDTVDTLEDQVAERTRQLETVVEVGQQLSGILDLSDLMRQVVTLTKETFNFYHVHIYLLESDILIMAEGYGQAGAEMKRRGHTISLAAPKSLVARAAREGGIITVKNVRENPDWLPNPLLPDTYAEMAVPVMLGSEVVGVLDVQSEKVAGLTPEDGIILQALANQVAIAVHNARLFTQTQSALYEAQRLQQVYTSHAWAQYGAGRVTLNYEVKQPTLPPLEQITTPEATAVLQQKQTVDLRLPESDFVSEDFDDEAADNGQSKTQEQHLKMGTALATPLKLHNEIIGVLGLRDEDPHRQWTIEEIALIESVSEQMSLAIENARLFDDTQQRAQRETLTREIADKIRGANNVEEILQTTVAELSRALGVSQTFIDLDIEANGEA